MTSFEPMDTETAEQINDGDTAEIGRQIAEGYTSGIIMTKKYTIQAKDVGHAFARIACESCGESERIEFSDVLGRVLSQDVGKMMVKHNGVWQVENNEQFTTRTKS